MSNQCCKSASRQWLMFGFIRPSSAPTHPQSRPVFKGIAGEREAISLALEVDADVLLLAEQAGRHEAEVRHIEVVGTLAFLLQASLRGYFDFPEVLKQLRRLVRASQAVEAVMLARYEQAKKIGP